MPRAPRRCSGCNQMVTGNGRCKTCASPSSKASSYNWAERKRRTAAITVWVEANGWVCPGYQRTPHPTNDLTAAHRDAVKHGGTHSPLTVLCRSCNSKAGLATTT